MSIKYVLVEKGKPSDPSIPKKYYAQAKSNGDITLRELSEKIVNISTVNSIDIIAVLEALLKMIPQELLNVNIVKLGDFGSFYTVITGKGADNIKDSHAFESEQMSAQLLSKPNICSDSNVCESNKVNESNVIYEVLKKASQEPQLLVCPTRATPWTFRQEQYFSSWFYSLTKKSSIV